MGFVVRDRVKESTTSTGATTFNLNGAFNSDSRTLADIGTGNQTYYAAINLTNHEWEVGIGTYTAGAPNTLSRDLVLANSAGTTAKISFTTAPTVQCDIPAYLAAIANVAALSALASMAGAF